MGSFRKPSQRQIHAFLLRLRQTPFSYAEVGASRDRAPRGYDLDHNRVVLGRGEAVFEAARTALSQWRMFPAPWTEIHPPAPPVEPGQAVANLVKVLGLWWLNGCRIVYVIDEIGPPRRYGFAYGTLAEHVERGEERFLVEWDADDMVWYDLRAFSRPRFWLARPGYPFARRAQRRFIRASQAAMQQAVQACVAARGS